MARIRRSILRIILTAVVCVLAPAWIHTPVALAQRGGVIRGGGHIGGPHVVPPVMRPAISQPRMMGAGPRMRMAARTFHIGRPVGGFRSPVFFGSPLFRLGFNFYGWPGCGAFWSWGFGCAGLPFYGYSLGFENYVIVPAYVSPPYFYGLYGGEQRELIELILKDGTIYYVTDYWFVNGQVHFIVIEEGGTKSVERKIDADELDLQRTVDVNTQHGFRVVMRDEPWQQYLKDHPDTTPPEITPPQKN